MLTLPWSKILLLNWPAMMNYHLLWYLAWNNLEHIYMCVLSIWHHFRSNSSGCGMTWHWQHSFQTAMFAKWSFTVPLSLLLIAGVRGGNLQSWLPLYWQAVQDRRSFFSLCETSGCGGEVNSHGGEVKQFGSGFFEGSKNQIITIF